MRQMLAASWDGVSEVLISMPCMEGRSFWQGLHMVGVRCQLCGSPRDAGFAHKAMVFWPLAEFQGPLSAGGWYSRQYLRAPSPTQVHIHRKPPQHCCCW